MRWHWLNHRITANICIALFHWSKFLCFILIMVLWGEYPVSHFADEPAESETHIINGTVRMQTQVFWLIPMFFYQYHAIQSGCHYDKVWYDKAIFYFLCYISKSELLFSNWNWTKKKSKIYYYKHNRDIRNLSSLGLCTIFSC